MEKTYTRYQVQFYEDCGQPQFSDWQDVRGAVYTTLDMAQANLEYRRGFFGYIKFRIVKLTIEVLDD